jgi:predicted PurR-regulated permease PerM
MRYVLLSATIVFAVLSATASANAASGSRELVEWMRYQRKLEIWERRQQQIIDRQQARTDRIMSIKFGVSRNARDGANQMWNGDARVPKDQMRDMAARFRKEHPAMRLNPAPR